VVFSMSTAVEERRERRTCKGECGETKTIDDFEVTLRDKATGEVKSRRAVCKRCYQRSKAAKAKDQNSLIDPVSVPKPASCVKCGLGSPDVEFKWRTDIAQGGWRSECNTCFNAKNYSATSRAKRREEDEEGYLRRNAETHLAWARRNPEKVKRQQHLQLAEPLRRIKMIRSQARDQDIFFEDADMDAMLAKLGLACTYCNVATAEGQALHGLDRVDPKFCNALGFTEANTVSCCALCNQMKAVYSVDVFLSQVRAIVEHRGLGVEEQQAPGIASVLPPPVVAAAVVFGGTRERRDAPSKDKDMGMLDFAAKLELWCGACYLCGRRPACGIDRVDASLGYSPENTMSCCSECNYLKKDLAVDVLEAHLSRINHHTRFWVLRCIMDEQCLTVTGCVRQAAGDRSGRVW